MPTSFVDIPSSPRILLGDFIAAIATQLLAHGWTTWDAQSLDIWIDYDVVYRSTGVNNDARIFIRIQRGLETGTQASGVANPEAVIFTAYSYWDPVAHVGFNETGGADSTIDAMNIGCALLGDEIDSFPIQAVDTGLDEFTLSGNFSTGSGAFLIGDHFRVSGSTGNDGIYTVASLTGTGPTDIGVVEQIPDSTADGLIFRDKSQFRFHGRINEYEFSVWVQGGLTNTDGFEGLLSFGQGRRSDAIPSRVAGWATTTTETVGLPNVSGVFVTIDIDRNLLGSLIKGQTLRIVSQSTGDFTQGFAEAFLDAFTVIDDLIDGETFTLIDAEGTTTVFEFDDDATVAGSNVPVTLLQIGGGQESLDDIAAAIILAINNDPIKIFALDQGGGEIELLQQIGGVAGNTAVAETVADPEFGFQGDFTGGTQGAPGSITNQTIEVVSVSGPNLTVTVKNLTGNFAPGAIIGLNPQPTHVGAQQAVGFVAACKYYTIFAPSGAHVSRTSNVLALGSHLPDALSDFVTDAENFFVSMLTSTFFKHILPTPSSEHTVVASSYHIVSMIAGVLVGSPGDTHSLKVAFAVNERYFGNFVQDLRPAQPGTTVDIGQKFFIGPGSEKGAANEGLAKFMTTNALPLAMGYVERIKTSGMSLAVVPDIFPRLSTTVAETRYVAEVGKHTIIAVSTGANTIDITQTGFFVAPAGTIFSIEGSTGNDGIYTILSILFLGGSDFRLTIDTQSRAITAVVAGAPGDRFFTVGSTTMKVIPGSRISVVGSTGNDQEYTVTDFVSEVGGELVIGVVEAIADTTPDGSVFVGDIADATIDGEAVFLRNVEFDSADMSIAVQGIEEKRLAGLSMTISGSSEQFVTIDVLMQATVTATAGLSVSVFAQPQVVAGLDTLIADRLPFRFMRLRGDLTTRYFTGHGSIGTTTGQPFPTTFLLPLVDTHRNVREDIGRFAMATHEADSLKARGQILLGAGVNTLNDGETFTLDDGVNTPTVFEFDDDGSVVETATLRQVVFAGADTGFDVRSAMTIAINNAPALDITASDAVGAATLLVADVAGLAANNPIAETVAGLFIVSGMIGGGGTAEFLRYTTDNTIPSASNFDFYFTSFDTVIDIDAIGWRILVNFRLDTFGDNSNILFGLANTLAEPAAMIGLGDTMMFAFETEKGHVEFRGFFGTGSTALNLGTAVSIDRFLRVPLVLEMELIDITSVYIVEYRLYERDKSLSVPFATFQVESPTPPGISRFVVSSLGKRTPELPFSDTSVVIDYLDIEAGPGFVVAEPTTGITAVTGKWRRFQDRAPIELLGEGTNEIFASLADELTNGFTAVDATEEARDTIIVDSEDPQIVVVSFSPDSSVLVPDTVNPPVLKGSLQSNFDEVKMTVYGTHAGTFTLRIDSTGVLDGTEILSQVYPVAGIETEIAFNFSDLPQTDDTYDVTLYLIADNGKITAKKLGEFILPFLGFEGEPAPFG